VADELPAGGRRVWIVNHYADAPDRPTGPRHFAMARQLVDQGRTVTIFAAGFSHLKGREERLPPRRLYRTADFEGVRFVWVWTFPYHGNTWRRQVNMLSFLPVFLVVQTRFRKPDSIMGSTVHPFAAFGAWLVARLRGARFVFEIRDLWPQTLVDLGAIRVGSPGERLLRTIEAFLVRRASAVVTLLPGIRDYLVGQGLPADHVVYVPNGVDLAAFDSRLAPEPDQAGRIEQSLDAIARMRAEGRLVIGYVGAIGRVNQVEVIVRAALIAEGRAPGRIALIIIGDGPERPDLERLVEPGAPIAFGPTVQRRFVPQLLRAMDAAVVHATATPVYRYGISFNKLFEYMAAAIPVVFACSSAYDPIATTGAGLSIPPDDPEALADAFLELARRTPAERAAMGAIGRAYVVNEHNVEQLARELATVL
jgi:glycosyltransferase involved in cell wall biosynthesis